jgi:hypothetical protein
MLKWLIRKRLAAFEREFGYDVSYLRDVLERDLGAFLAFAKAAGVARYRKDAPLDVYHAVKLTGSIVADCGPCTQLGVGMALRDGLPPVTVAKIVRGNLDEMTGPTRLGAQFARAVLARDPAADEVRAELVTRYGERAVISMALALVGSQLFPTFKYALGYGHACSRIEVDGASIAPRLAVA